MCRGFESLSRYKNWIALGVGQVANPPVKSFVSRAHFRD